MRSVRAIRLASIGVACLVIGAAAPVLAQSMCTDTYDATEIADGKGHEPQNVVLIVLDDASANELPGLNLPIQWETPNAPASASVNEAGLQRPDLNRLSARAFAQTSGALGLAHVNSSTNADAIALVVPYDVGGDAGSFSYAVGTGALSSTHALKGFGGLGRLAREGVAYSRHYAPSGRCAPTRASIFTGRSNLEVGVSDNGAPLDVTQITVADFLKDRSDVSYRTGLVGKWHMRNGDDRSCWQRGFDETFHYEAPSRRHDKNTSLFCAPLRSDLGEPRKHCADSWSPGHRCISDADCNTSLPAADKCGAAGGCVCAPGNYDYGTGNAGECYLKKPLTCTTTCVSGADCRPWGKYLGPEPRSARAGCHPDDKDNPLCCIPPDSSVSALDGADVHADKYSFDQGVNTATNVDGVMVPDPFWRVDVGSDPVPSQPCYYDDKSPFDTSTPASGSGGGGCRYDTRYYRDAAKNFILRNANAPFFLYLAPHGVHAPNSAPKRVEAHYDTLGAKPRAPFSRKKFWGALEEVDAAVGQILTTLEGTKTCTGVGKPTYGLSCTSNGDCTSPGKCTTLASKTLVLLTADQGRPGSGYGEPALRGGKGSVSEGGVRVGLHVWSGTGNALGIAPITAESSADLKSEVSNVMSTHADLMATIAHASGCKPENVNGQYKVSICNNSTRDVCSAGDSCGGNGCVVDRLLAGRTVLPRVSAKVKGYATATGSVIASDPVVAARDFAFAQYSGAGKAIIARKGLFPFGTSSTRFGVCGTVTQVPAGTVVDTTTVPVTTSPIDRVRRAGSTTFCNLDDANPNTTCTDLGEAGCPSIGKFCVPQNLITLCGTGDPACKWKAYARCRGPKDCSGNDKCTAVRQKCEKCFEPTFKLRGAGGDSATNVDARDLFDLTTNPEELDELNLAFKTIPVLPTESLFAAVENDLRERLGGWSDCVRDGSTTSEKQDCENCYQSSSTPAICPDAEQ